MRHVAMGLLIDERRRMLLGRRSLSKPILPGVWDAIGGRLEAGETPQAALVREIWEELGVIARRYKLLESAAQTGAPAPYWLWLFAVTEWDGAAPRNLSPEHDALAWFPLGALARLGPRASRSDLARLLDDLP